MTKILTKPYSKYRKVAFEKIIKLLEKHLQSVYKTKSNLDPKLCRLYAKAGRWVLNYDGRLFYFELNYDLEKTIVVKEVENTIIRLGHSDTADLTSQLAVAFRYANKWMQEVVATWEMNTDYLQATYNNGSIIRFEGEVDNGLSGF